MRTQAGRYLSKLSNCCVSGDLSDEQHALRVQLEAIRFGPEVDQGSAHATFRAARRILRKRA